MFIATAHTFAWGMLNRGIEDRSRRGSVVATRTSVVMLGHDAGIMRGWGEVRRLCCKPHSCWNIFHIKDYRAERGTEEPCWPSSMLIIPSLTTAGHTWRPSRRTVHPTYNRPRGWSPHSMSLIQENPGYEIINSPPQKVLIKSQSLSPRIGEDLKNVRSDL